MGVEIMVALSTLIALVGAGVVWIAWRDRHAAQYVAPTRHAPHGVYGHSADSAGSAGFDGSAGGGCAADGGGPC